MHPGSSHTVETFDARHPCRCRAVTVRQRDRKARRVLRFVRRIAKQANCWAPLEVVQGEICASDQAVSSHWLGASGTVDPQTRA